MSGSRPPTAAAIRLGLRENLAQFTLLVIVNAFVGAMVGIERSILPAIAEQDFAIALQHDGNVGPRADQPPQHALQLLIRRGAVVDEQLVRRRLHEVHRGR